MKAKNAGNGRKARSTEEGENSPSAIATGDIGMVKTSSGSQTDLSYTLDGTVSHLPYRFDRCRPGSGKGTFFGACANGSSRSGLDRIRLSPYRSKAHEPPMRSALILAKTANKESLSAFPAIPAVSAL
jgi:hypothetical protein